MSTALDLKNDFLYIALATKGNMTFFVHSTRLKGNVLFFFCFVFFLYICLFVFFLFFFFLSPALD